MARLRRSKTAELPRSSEQRRWFSLISLVAFSVLVLGYLWGAKFEYAHRAYLAIVFAGVLFLTLVNHLVHNDDLGKLGLRFDNLGKATTRYGLATLAACLLIAAAGLVGGRFEAPSWTAILLYMPWAAIQQHLLQNFLRLRATEVLGEKQGTAWGAALLAAALFAAFHLPNPVLVTAAFAGGLLWCGLFTRVPSLPWAVLSQTLITTTLLLFFKYTPLNQFEVGMPGFRYDYYGSGVKVAAGYDAQGKPFVATLPGPDRGVTARIRLYDDAGHPKAGWTAFESLDFSGEIAVGDLGYGPGDEVVVAAGPGRRNPPRVRVYDRQGNPLADFLAEQVGGSGFGAWVSVRCGRIYAGPGPGPGAPQVLAEYSPQGRLLRSWLFDDLGFVNGLRGTGLCPRGETREPARIVLWASDIAVNPSTVVVVDTRTKVRKPIETIRTTFGAQVALVQIEDHLAFALAPGPLRGYPALIAVTTFEGRRLSEFSAIDDPDSHGANLAAIDIDGDGVEELVLGQGIGPGRLPKVWLFSIEGELRTSWELPSG